MKLSYIPPAMRMIVRRVRIAVNGVRKYEGSCESICRQIINDCYVDGRFQVSTGHFKDFYARDFGWTCEALLKLGYKKQVLSTLAYALEKYSKHGKIEQSISASGECFTFPEAVSIDALAFLIRSLKHAGAQSLVRKHKDFLEGEVKRISSYVDKKTGLVKREVHTSTMKDYAVRPSSCYDNCMLGMLSEDLSILGLQNPLARYDYEKLIVKHFWKKNFFAEDLSGSLTVCGDANVLPIWSGVVKDKEKIASVLKTISAAGLDKPFPLKYTASRDRKQKMIGLEWLAGDYERDTIWMHIGVMYLRVLQEHDPSQARKCLAHYKKLVEEHGTFLEVYDSKGEPFKTWIYYTDEGMSWCANLLV